MKTEDMAVIDADGCRNIAVTLTDPSQPILNERNRLLSTVIHARRRVSRVNSQVGFFTIGLIFLFGAVVSTVTGKTLARFRGVIDRNKEPREFWWTVTIYYLTALFFFYCHLYGRPW